MQLVNTLVFSKVIQMPTVTEMAEWISENTKLGAVTGLNLLGFRTATRDQIQGSYICFHNFWRDSLLMQIRCPRFPSTVHGAPSLQDTSMGQALGQGQECNTSADRCTARKWSMESRQEYQGCVGLPLPSVAMREDLQLALNADADEVCAQIWLLPMLIQIYRTAVSYSQLRMMIRWKRIQPTQIAK
ncbi:hypothetical protein B0H10DRAFT_2327206 [Mycena sp. CBHHK59/15]|nr:hypothetical protein B0H10DRAFT_2327206 [Mycena sp. CBHHK59/15]